MTLQPAAADNRPESTIQVGAPATWDNRIREMFVVIDTKSIDGFLSYVAADATFRFGNGAWATGHAAIRELLGPFFASIEALQHSIQGTWVQNDAAFCRLEVKYTRLDGKKVTLPVGNFFRFRDDLITEYQIYMDIGPVYAASI
jgi:ketosteroid isomerase-like protein